MGKPVREFDLMFNGFIFNDIGEELS